MNLRVGLIIISFYNRQKIYEAISRNQAKLDWKRKLWNLFLRNFRTFVANFYLLKEDWVLGSASYNFCDFSNIS